MIAVNRRKVTFLSATNYLSKSFIQSAIYLAAF